jgi:pimeloyl-ACP methyl ester carboxylesterase
MVNINTNIYSSGPLPEELLPKCPVPVSFLWGEDDQWESVELGQRELSIYPCVQNFVRLSGAGHCPMDQVPDEVNKNVLNFLQSGISWKDFQVVKSGNAESILVNKS